MKKHAVLHPCLLLTVGFLYVLLVGCVSKPLSKQETIARITRLTQSGEREQAVTLAKSFLQENPDATVSEKCQVYFFLAAASGYTNDIETAQETLASYDQQCSDLPQELMWLHNEAATLKTELGLNEGQPYVPPDDGFWEKAEGASLGLDPDVLTHHQAWCETTGADGCLVVYQGKIVQEWYSSRYHLPAYAMSSTKSVAGLLTGMLIDDGKIPSIDEPVCTYVSEWCAGAKAQVTLRHLLSMTAGFENLSGKESVGAIADKNQHVIDLPLSHKPGTQWVYSNEGAQLLSPILDRAAGEPIQDYARRRLFEPLGMLDTRLNLDAAGHAWLYADMETSLRDFARLGILMLNQGRWGDQQIVGADWVAQSTRPSQDLNPGYGLLWWLIDDPGGYKAFGHLETNLYVFPEMNLVVARMQRFPSDMPEGSYEPDALEMFRQMIAE